MRTEPRFQHRVAILAGSSRGIGKACALTLAREGARVVLNATGPLDDVLAEFSQANLPAIGIRADAAAPETGKQLVDAAITKWGRIDLIVNVVGITGHIGPLREIPYQKWADAMVTNTWPSLGLVQAAMDAGLGRLPGAAVVNISSIGSRLELPGLATYNASKLALESLTRAMAAELGPLGVRVNAVAPGIIRTEMGKNEASGELGARRAAHMPLRRIGEPQDVANAVAFLLSGEASFITGVVLDVDGGYLTVGAQGS